MTTLALPVGVRDVLVNYLAKRPWQEVAQLISALATLEEAPEPPAEPEVPTDLPRPRSRSEAAS